MRLIDWYLLGLLLAAMYFFVSHASMDLDFMAKTSAGKPIWRNHVNYACALVTALPLTWFRFKTAIPSTRQWKYLLLALVFLCFLYFSYARVAYLCLFTAGVYFIVLKMRITKWVISLAVVMILLLMYQLKSENNYLQLAPEFNQAITQERFDRKVSATLEGRDISTMERLYRWVSGVEMIKSNPWTGVGPSNFYTYYKRYSIRSFETYVSDNPEKSGIHNYFLMLAVEQGIPGLILFVLVGIVSLLHVERIYHTSTYLEVQLLMITMGMVMVMMLTLNTINDMIEVIKIGGWFFFALFLISKGEHIVRNT